MASPLFTFSLCMNISLFITGSSSSLPYFFAFFPYLLHLTYLLCCKSDKTFFQLQDAQHSMKLSVKHIHKKIFTVSGTYYLQMNYQHTSSHDTRRAPGCSTIFVICTGPILDTLPASFTNSCTSWVSVGFDGNSTLTLATAHNAGTSGKLIE